MNSNNTKKKTKVESEPTQKEKEVVQKVASVLVDLVIEEMKQKRLKSAQ